jgi:hypothetical protein
MRLRRTIGFLTLFASVALLPATLAPGKTPRPVKFSAALNIGQEVPHPKGTKAGASGRFTATVTGTTLKWRLTFTHLSGSATAAHIHRGARGVSGPIVVPLCGPCTSPLTGTSNVTEAVLNEMLARKMYVNVHTEKNPNGEIRGQITRAL